MFTKVDEVVFGKLGCIEVKSAAPSLSAGEQKAKDNRALRCTKANFQTPLVVSCGLHEKQPTPFSPFFLSIKQMPRYSDNRKTFRKIYSFYYLYIL